MVTTSVRHVVRSQAESTPCGRPGWATLFELVCSTVHRLWCASIVHTPRSRFWSSPGPKHGPTCAKSILIDTAGCITAIYDKTHPAKAVKPSRLSLVRAICRLPDCFEFVPDFDELAPPDGGDEPFPMLDLLSVPA